MGYRSRSITHVEKNCLVLIFYYPIFTEFKYTLSGPVSELVMTMSPNTPRNTLIHEGIFPWGNSEWRNSSLPTNYYCCRNLSCFTVLHFRLLLPSIFAVISLSVFNNDSHIMFNDSIHILPEPGSELTSTMPSN